MRDHASVSPTFWVRGTGKLLRGDPAAQVVALYLMTCPSASMTGLFHLSLPALAHETGLGTEGASKALARCIEVRFCDYDEAEELVWIPNLARYQVGISLAGKDKRVAGLVKSLRPFVRHRFYQFFLDLYADAYGITPESAAPSFDVANKPLPRGPFPDPVLSCPDPVLSCPVPKNQPTPPESPPSI